MRGSLKFIGLVVFLICSSSSAAEGGAFGARASGAVTADAPPADAGEAFGPSDLFDDFPQISWGMSFEEAKRALEKAGARPGGFGRSRRELAWDGTFAGLSGRATVLFKEGAGAYEVAVIVHAMEKRREVFEQWAKKITERLGAAKEGEDNSIDTSKLWRLKGGVVLELRLIKDDDSPVVDIHWVKE